MNEDDLRLLQAAAAARTESGAPSAPVLDAGPAVAVDDNNLELRAVVADLSTDQINEALAALAGTMDEKHDDDKSQAPPQPPPPPLQEGTTLGPNTTIHTEFNFEPTEDPLENLRKLLGFDDPDVDVVDAILRQHNVSSVAKVMDVQSPETDYEGTLADLQRSLAALSHPATRANSPPAEVTAVPELDPTAAANLVSWITDIANRTVGGPAPFIAAPPAQPRGGRTRQSSIADPFEDPVKAAEKERIRVENRERKKKWRNQNQERNKDNDLRCRVTKRANQLYGMATTVEKTHWVEREFNRRRSKRVTRKEQRTNDNPAGGNPGAGSSSVFPAFSNSNSSSPPPSFSPVSAEKGNYVFTEGFQAEEQMVDIMRLMVALSGEPGILSTLMQIAVENGYNEEVLTAHYDLTPGGSVDGGENGVENPDFTTGNLGGLDTLNTWTPEASMTPAATDIQQASQQGSQVCQGSPNVERHDQIEPGFDEIVANLERGLREHQERQNNIDQDVKHEPASPNFEGNNATPALETLALENLDSDNIDDAIASLLREDGGAAVNEHGEVEFNDDTLERLLAENGMDVDVERFLNNVGDGSTTPIQGPAEGVAGVGVDHYRATADNDDDRRELAQQIQQARLPSGGPVDSGCFPTGNDLPAADGMSLDEINKLLADLAGAGDAGPMQLDISAELAPQQTLPSPPLPSPPPAHAPTPPEHTFFNPDPDTSALYTKETIIAIFKTIIETSSAHVQPPPPPPQPRGTKRHSPSSYSNSSKRICNHAPGVNMNQATMAALSELNGLLNNGAFLNRNQHPTAPPQSAQSQAYVASFGTTDGMNKRLMAMKPPPYRPGGSGVGGGGAGAVGTGVQVKRKTGEEEKKVRAMGFPPLMAGMKRKL